MGHVGIDNRLAYHRQAGITRYTRNLMQALHALDSGCRFTVFHHRRQGDAPFPYPGWQHRTLISPVHHAWEQRMLQWELKRFRLDVAHFPDFIGPYLTDLATVITVHDLGFHYWPDILTDEARNYYGQLDRAIAHARIVLVPTHHTGNDLLQFHPQARHKVRVVHSAVDPVFQQAETTVQANPAPAWLPPDYLLHVGTIEPRKNIQALLEAFRIVRERGSIPDLHLVLAGAPGWLEDDLEQQVRTLGLEEHCIFPGQISEMALIQTYARARCLVHPARYEGFGFTLLESMACGTPVVASTAACLPEIAGDAALFADPDDAEGLARQVMRLLREPELVQVQIAQGRRRVADFSWTRTARLTLDAYREALSSAPHPRHRA